ncbi:unnamed protein product [Rodentolepis nana]|uniref:Short chain dehydrogenase n=1 Tax=Rodentolepis nana TaxID=102285 RepID=A0A0R3TXB2_RODNA|nr:unnamed protein product [Rodentolepis nana]
MRTLATAVVVFLLAFGIGLLMRFWPQSCLCHVHGRLDGKVALVTDGPSFMGVEVAAELARRGATVYIGSQSRNHFNIIKDNILRLYGESGEREKYDFANERVLKDLTPIKESQSPSRLATVH